MYFQKIKYIFYYCLPGFPIKSVDIRGANLFALQEAKFYYNDLHSFQWQHQQHVLQTCTMVHTTTVNVIVLYYYYSTIYLDSRLNHVLTLLLASGATQLLLVKIEGWLVLCSSIQLVLLLQHKDAFNHNFLSSMDDPFSNLPPYCPASEEWCK